MKISPALLKVGSGYSKAELAELFDAPDLVTIREGLYGRDGQDYILFFVTLNKEKADPSVAYNDYFEDGLFFWESQHQNTLQSKWIKKIATKEVTPLLFVREVAKINGRTQKFVFAGQLEDPTPDESSSRPVKFTFFPADLTGEEGVLLKPLVDWNPGDERRQGLNKDFAAKVELLRMRTSSKSEVNSDEIGRAPGAYRPGPTPKATEYFVSTEHHEDWFIYILALSNSQAAKVGMSHDPKARLREYNHSIMPEITGLSWSLSFSHKVQDAETAKMIEQKVLRKFSKYQLQSNGEILREVDLMSVQLAVIDAARSI